MLCALKTAVVGTDSSTLKSLLDKNDSFEYCALCYGKKFVRDKTINFIDI